MRCNQTSSSKIVPKNLKKKLEKKSFSQKKICIEIFFTQFFLVDAIDESQKSKIRKEGDLDTKNSEGKST